MNDKSIKKRINSNFSTITIIEEDNNKYKEIINLQEENISLKTTKIFKERDLKLFIKINNWEIVRNKTLVVYAL